LNIIPLVVFGAVLVGTIIIGLILSPYHIYTEVDRKRNKLQAQLDTRPSIEVRPVNKFDDYYLEVKNIGNAGKFEAEIQMLESNTLIPSELNQYKACWETTKSREVQILKDQTDRVKIARFVSYPPHYQSQHLSLYYYNSQSGQESHIDSDGYKVGAKIISENGKERPLTKPGFILRVTISSKPSLKEGSFIKKYKLGLDGLEELQN